jgi:exopolyphosphatase/guanosine-5'-triphosphate,3'-diphosphate pyrophosphatase
MIDIPRVLAAADIGSNTAHILVARADSQEVVRLSDTNEWLSLGEIVTRHGSIPEETEALLAKTMRAFRRLAHLYDAEGIYVFATEAMRKASNGKEIIERLAKEGIPIDLIDGRREAELGMRGAWLDCAQRAPRVILAEVGGGSAQISFAGANGPLPVIQEERSLPLGTGTLIGKLGITQPADDNQIKRLVDYIETMVKPLFPSPKGRKAGTEERPYVVGVGGVARGVWRSLHPDGDPFVEAEEIDYLIWATQRLTEAQISQRFNVKLKRAATLLPGAVLYRTILGCAGETQLKVSRFGVREGAILEMAEGRIKPWPV